MTILEQGNVWENNAKHVFIAPHHTTGPDPIIGRIYVVAYVDIERVAFKNPTNGQITVEKLFEMKPFQQLIDVLEPGDIWEVVRETTNERVWRRPAFVISQTEEFAVQKNDHPLTHTFELDRPYRLKEWNTHVRIWVDQYVDQEVVEVLRNPNELNATQGNGQVTVQMTLRGKPINVMIDSGATGNFISPKALARLNIPITKIKPYVLQVVDGTKIDYQDGIIDQGTVPSKLRSKDGHVSDVQFDIATTGKHEAILGMPWIREHNPEIDWISNEIRFGRCNCEGSQL